jgi:chaperonin GroES
MSEQTQLKLKPVGYRIVAKKLEEESTLKGGIILPDSAKKKQETVLVVAVGSSKRLDNGKEKCFPAVKKFDITDFLSDEKWDCEVYEWKNPFQAEN